MLMHTGPFPSAEEIDAGRPPCPATFRKQICGTYVRRRGSDLVCYECGRVVWPINSDV